MTRDRLFLAGLGLLVAVGLAAGPVMAATAVPWPFEPPRAMQAGDLAVSVAEWDGTAWRAIGGLTVQPEAFCTAPVRPERPAG